MVERQRVAGRLRSASRWFLDVELQPSTGGWNAAVRVDPNVAKARAEQQGLPDGSLKAAAKDDRVRHVCDTQIARVNASLPSGQRIALLNTY